MSQREVFQYDFTVSKIIINRFIIIFFLELDKNKIKSCYSIK